MTNDIETNLWKRVKTVTPFSKSSISSENNVEIVKPKVTLFSPSSLLIESLIEHICTLIEKDSSSKQKLYLTICQKLNELQLIDKSYLIEDFNFMRNHYKQELYHLITVAKSVTPSIQNYNNNNDNNTSAVLTRSNVTNKYSKLFEWSRFSTEFNELEFIARGGFGEVVKVQNKLDAEIYAIKKICLKYCSINGFIRGLSEVQMLAKLNHPNIIFYKAAWLEPLITCKKQETKALCSVDKSDSKKNESSDIIFLYSEQPNNSENKSHCEQSSSSEDVHELIINQTYSNAITEDDCSNGSAAGNELLHLKNLNLYSKHKCGQNWAVLFIQMQLCHQTLRQWLDVRSMNNNLIDNISQSLYIFLQILKGIEFIHSKGIVHHDIKPNNIFISEDEKNIQVGDFGLSCCLLHNACPDTAAASGFSFPNCPVSAIHQRGEFGTKLYAAPEQLKGICNFKSDMYSLGILLFELTYLFHTDMERIKKINDLRNGILPDDLSVSFPKITHVITSLVTDDFENRPMAGELLKEISEMSELDEFCDEKDKTIKQLKKELIYKNEEIALLKKKLISLQNL